MIWQARNTSGMAAGHCLVRESRNLTVFSPSCIFFILQSSQTVTVSHSRNYATSKITRPWCDLVLCRIKESCIALFALFHRPLSLTIFRIAWTGARCRSWRDRPGSRYTTSSRSPKAPKSTLSMSIAAPYSCAFWGGSTTMLLIRNVFVRLTKFDGFGFIWI